MRRPACSPRPKRVAAAGFTLVELVVVVMILGILASIAAPKLLGMSGKAVDNGLRHTLSIIRDAIDRYSADHEGELPGDDGQESTFKSEVAPYLRGIEFPVCPVGPAKNNLVQTMTGSAVAAAIAAAEPTHGWLYNYGTGEFYAACDDQSSDNVTPYNQF
jgi:prepilin-type N-terminal cleavage/methylation domain-containing protein